MDHLLLLQWRPAFLLVLVLLTISDPSHGEVGISIQYSPPYLRTACYGNDLGQFPSNNLFAAAGDGIWDNGAACGWQYRVKCIRPVGQGTCDPEQETRVTIVDVIENSAHGTTMALSTSAFGTIANAATTTIFIDFIEIS